MTFEDVPLLHSPSLEEALKWMGENVVKGKKRKYRVSVAWHQCLAPDSRILGGEDFVKGVLGGADKRLRMQMKNKGGEDSIVRVIKERCVEAGLKEEELRSRGKRRKVSDVRGKIGYYLSKEMGLSMAEIARNLGVGASAIGMAIRRMENEEKK
jgi:hypothetical protein